MTTKASANINGSPVGAEAGHSAAIRPALPRFARRRQRLQSVEEISGFLGDLCDLGAHRDCAPSCRRLVASSWLARSATVISVAA
jgi:hypothetical protein